MGELWFDAERLKEFLSAFWFPREIFAALRQDFRNRSQFGLGWPNSARNAVISSANSFSLEVLASEEPERPLYLWMLILAK